MQVQGYVDDLITKQTKVGPMYDIKVGGDFYGVGKYPPRDIGKGDYVEFVMEQNGNFRNVGRGTLRKIDAPAATGQNKLAAPARVAAGPTWDDKQATISKQAALNTAIAMVKMAVEAGAVTLPTKKGDQYDVLEAIVLEQASRFHNISTGHPIELPTSGTPKSKPRAKAATAEAPDDGEWEDELPE